MANVFIENATLQDIANAIRNKTGKTEKMLPNQMPVEIESIEAGDGGYEQGFEDGKNSVMDLGRFCDIIRFKNLNVFGKSEVELNLPNCTTLNRLCFVESPENTNNTVEHLTINAGSPTDAGWILGASIGQLDQKLKHLTLNWDMKNLKKVDYAFYGLQALQVIDGVPFDFSSLTSLTGIFHMSTAIVEMRFVPLSIKVNFLLSLHRKLSAETIQSIIDGLADLTGGATQTLTFHSDVGNKLTDTQKATITAKNWTLVY